MNTTTATTDKTLIETPFGFESTALEVVDGIDLAGQTAIVTGSSSGIGVETARALASAGAAVTLAVRDTALGEQVQADIAGTTGNGNVTVKPLDLATPDSIAAFVTDWSGPLNLLVNNAGVMAIQELSHDSRGHELQFATNHLGHFQLTTGLHDALAKAGTARVVSLSSSAHLMSPVVWDDIDFAFRAYEPFLAYGQSKTANVLFAVGATKRWAGEGITVNAVMPGGIATKLQRHVAPDYIERRRRETGGRLKLKTAEQGASTSVVVATSPLLDSIGGRYFEDCNEAPTVTSRTELGGMKGVARYAVDEDNADRLWELSEQLVG